MRYVLTAEEMKKMDTRTIEEFGVPSCVLMERAAMMVRDEILEQCPEIRSALILCGSGNNGGDGLALARLLYQMNVWPTVVMVGNPDKATEETKRQMGICQKYGVDLLDEIPADEDYDAVVDAIFGIGLSRPIEGKYKDIIEEANLMDGLKVAVDIPSGIHADSGQVLGCAFQADVTITMAFPKYGQILYPGRNYVGELVVAEIGITEDSAPDPAPRGRVYEEEDLIYLPDRIGNSNKGTYGKVLAIAGSYNMAGAGLLAGEAAYRVGSGLVYIYTPEENRIIMQTGLPEAVLKTYSEQETFSDLEDLIKPMTAVLCGPGIGTSETARRLVDRLLTIGDKPLVLDADALNIIAADPKLQEKLHDYPDQVIITPHMGEAARLLGWDMKDLKADPIKAAKTLTEKFHVETVLKDAVTVVAKENGIVFLNTTGNNGMSTGGSGDVLSGIIIGLIATGLSSAFAGSYGVYIHGMAGDYAREKLGSYSMLARDIIDGLVCALQDIETMKEDEIEL